MRYDHVMRIMGLDVGTKRIGVAVSDGTGTLAQGKRVVLRTSDAKALDEIGRMIEELGIATVVVGMPLNMNGTKGPSAGGAERFGSKLAEKAGVHVVYWDERLSTKEIEDMMIRSSVRRKDRRNIIDKMAAQLILQNYLDSKEGPGADIPG